jgi:hypothetical protein
MIDAQPITIDPDAWYSDGQARILLGLAGATLTRARRSGDLRHTKVGHRILYRGAWLVEWLNGERRVTQ